MPRWDVKFDYGDGKSEMVEYISANTPDAAIRVASSLRLSSWPPKNVVVSAARPRNWA